MFRSILSFGLTRRPIIILFVLVFLGSGAFAVSQLNVEAYPNPAPVILEITAQAAGLSAEEMEKYYTIPMEVGLYSTPGVVNIRSTSFYGLSFVRVTFKYGVDYYFALSQATNNLTQNVQLPGNQIPQIQQSSLVGEIFRYQLVGPPIGALLFAVGAIAIISELRRPCSLMRARRASQRAVSSGTTFQASNCSSPPAARVSLNEGCLPRSWASSQEVSSAWK